MRSLPACVSIDAVGCYIPHHLLADKPINRSEFKLNSSKTHFEGKNTTYYFYKLIQGNEDPG